MKVSSEGAVVSLWALETQLLPSYSISDAQIQYHVFMLIAYSRQSVWSNNARFMVLGWSNQK